MRIGVKLRKALEAYSLRKCRIGTLRLVSGQGSGVILEKLSQNKMGGLVP